MSSFPHSCITNAQWRPLPAGDTDGLLWGGPGLFCPRRPSVILVAPTGILSAPPLRHSRGPAREFCPRRPSVILVAPTGIQACRVCISFRRHDDGKAAKNPTATPQLPTLPSFSRALPGNSVPNCEQQDWIPAFGENDGREGFPPDGWTGRVSRLTGWGRDSDSILNIRSTERYAIRVASQ